MTEATLEDLEGAFLDAPCMAILGDTIRYRPSGGSFRTAKAYVEYQGTLRSLDTGQVIEQDITVQILANDLAAKPGGTARITLPKIPGITYKPANIRRDRSGTHWEFELVRVNA